MKTINLSTTILSTLGLLAQALPSPDATLTASNRLVFAHFMIGIVSNRNKASDYDSDMQRAKSLGIDAFALNIGVDPYTDQQLGLAYESAANNGMKVFISFDFNWYHTGQGTQVGQKIAQYASKPAQLMVDDKVFVSSFAGDGLDVAAMRSAAGRPVFFAPNFHPSYGTNMDQVDGLLNWMAWPNDGNNKAPRPGANVSVQAGDQEYIRALGGKAYIAPASPWFFTHFGPEVSYSKNWVFPGDLLWYERWNDLLTLGPRFIEIVTWNDYGESHYIGPLSSPHTDDGCSKWVNDMPHDGWLDISKPYISAYKAGATSVDSYINDEELVYWYRPAPRDVNCDATDTCMVGANNSSGNYFMGRPNGWESMADAVFVVAMLKSPATVTVNSGGKVQTFEAPAGASAFQAPMGVGSQWFALSRGGQTVMSGTSLLPIIDGCVCGLYNFNPYVGSLPAQPLDVLQPDGLAAFTSGLKVSTCQATPSLGKSTPTPPPSASTTSGGTAPPTTTSKSSTTATTTKSPTTTSQPTTTTRTTTTTSQSSTTTTTGSPPGTACIGGTGPGNYLGLCDFCCHYGYCPPGPCTCTKYGAPVPTPPTTGVNGVPLAGLDDSYLGLCSFACNHGYCPPTACTTR
ncbi:putative alpha-1,3-glucanase/mutanase [Aspergillus taichungensis]|uniref:Putative alpha-1,3-glucanase/mutanase n=1 Tax=Aspergillus taichungensis TaxID=482145 RepID=A0A2J5IAA9_9EURO|nr:putative alpha-1,3-glucanase/mutanase [Aspergillus taichungensis]